MAIFFADKLDENGYYVDADAITDMIAKYASNDPEQMTRAAVDLRKTFHNIGRGLSKMDRAVGKGMDKAYDWVAGTAGNAASAVGNAAGNAWNSAGKTIGEYGNAAGNYLTSTGVEQKRQQFLNWAKEYAAKTGQTVQGVINSMSQHGRPKPVQNAAQDVQSAGQQLSSFKDKTWGALNKALTPPQ
jgi:hypothetical protein